MDIHVLILGAALIVIVSFLFNQISRRTHIPSVLMLMLLGYVMTFFVELPEAQLMPALKVLGTIGVILIVLEAALDIHLEKDKLPILAKASLLALVLLLVTAGIIAGAMVLILGMNLLTSLFYAVPLAVMSSAIIIPSVHNLTAHKKEFLIFESALSDILGIIIFYALLDFHHASPEESVGASLAFKTLLTIGISFVVSYALILIFQYGRGHATLFVLIASLVALYALGKLQHMSSLIIILVFGLVLNNRNIFFQGRLKAYINENDIAAVLKEFKSITLETAFVVRTFFFVAFGMSIVLSQLLNWVVPVVTLIVLIAIYASRYIGLRTIFLKDIEPEIYVAPRGLITILLFYQIPEDIVTEAFPPGILLLTILITSFVMTYGLIKESKKVVPEVSMGGEPPVEGPFEMPASQDPVITPGKTIGPSAPVGGE
ncbi:MAG: cation:proton antiporter [Bacteroidota bacterium]